MKDACFFGFFSNSERARASGRGQNEIIGNSFNPSLHQGTSFSAVGHRKLNERLKADD